MLKGFVHKNIQYLFDWPKKSIIASRASVYEILIDCMLITN